MIAHDCERFPDRSTRHSERIWLPSREHTNATIADSPVWLSTKVEPIYDH